MPLTKLNPWPFALTTQAHQPGTPWTFFSHSASVSSSNSSFWMIHCCFQPMTVLLLLSSAVAYDCIGFSYIYKHSWGTLFNSAHPQLSKHCQFKASSLCSTPVLSSNFLGLSEVKLIESFSLQLPLPAPVNPGLFLLYFLALWMALSSNNSGQNPEWHYLFNLVALLLLTRLG